MVSSRAAFLALRAAIDWYADVWSSQSLEIFAYEMDLLPDGASADPALSAIFIQMATYDLPDISRAFKVSSEFVRAEIIDLRKIELGVQIEADLLLASQHDQNTADFPVPEPIALFRYAIEHPEDDAKEERHARYWHLEGAL